MKRGFTLVELIIVMAIVALLSTISLNGYLQYRKAAVLNLSADNFLAQIAQMRAETIYGDVSGERFKDILAKINEGNSEIEGKKIDPICKGIFFEVVDENYQARIFSQNFSSNYVWDGEEWLYEGCNGGMDFSDLDLDQAINFTFDEVSENFYLRFAPPFGVMESDLALELLQMQMYYGTDEEEKLDLFFDFKNGKFGAQ